MFNSPNWLYNGQVVVMFNVIRFINSVHTIWFTYLLVIFRVYTQYYILHTDNNFALKTKRKIIRRKFFN